jgi:hypothetical protein
MLVHSIGHDGKPITEWVTSMAITGIGMPSNEAIKAQERLKEEERRKREEQMRLHRND